MSDWLRLALTPGLGDATARKLLARFGLPAQIFSASHGDLAPVVGEAQARRVSAARSDATIQAGIDEALQWLQAPDSHVVTLADADYPRSLLDIPDPPAVLYLKGRREMLGRPALALVGSRNATAQGIANAEQFAAALSRAGYAVVSGQALGIDTAAHRGGLSGAGSTIAVIGTGADVVYPARNRSLAHEIAEKGLIVSEFPLKTPALAENFPRRNRIISGLSRGVVVIEAALRSGSLITARLAGEQGREVFAIPGSIHSPLSKGCHLLIKQGAKLVDAVEDILEELGTPLLPSGAPAPREVAPAALDDALGALLKEIGHDPVTVDVLARRTGQAADRLMAALMELELAGRVAQLPGGRVQRIGS